MKRIIALLVVVGASLIAGPSAAQNGQGTHISNLTVTPVAGGWLIDWDTSAYADQNGSHVAVWHDITQPPERPCPEIRVEGTFTSMTPPFPSECLVTNLVQGQSYQINVRSAFESGTTISYVAEPPLGLRGREIQGKYIVVTPNTDNCYRTGKAFHCPVDQVNHIVRWDIPVVTIMRHHLWETGPFAKAVMIDHGQGLKPQLQGYQGWTFGGTPPVVLNAPDWGYEINIDTGEWIAPDGHGVLQ